MAGCHKAYIIFFIGIPNYTCGCTMECKSVTPVCSWVCSHGIIIIITDKACVLSHCVCNVFVNLFITNLQEKPTYRMVSWWVLFADVLRMQTTNAISTIDGRSPAYAWYCLYMIYTNPVYIGLSLSFDFASCHCICFGHLYKLKFPLMFKGDFPIDWCQQINYLVQ
jgi:hypothetical protein